MHERSSKNSMKKFVSIALLLLKGKKKKFKPFKNHLPSIYYATINDRLCVILVI